jgi:hypothetical protein
LLWAYGSGHFGVVDEQLREPARMTNQINSEHLKLIAPPAPASASEAQAAAPLAPGELAIQEEVKKEAMAKETAPVAPNEAAPAATLLACIEIGNFTSAEATAFESRLALLALGQRQLRIDIAGPEATSYIVYLPAQGGKEGAQRSVAQLQRLGVQNYFIMADNAALRWSVSLGVFKSETAAQNLLASLTKLGVTNARIAPRTAPRKLLAFQLRRLGFETQARLKQIKAAFPAQQMRACQAAPG